MIHVTLDFVYLSIIFLTSSGAVDTCFWVKGLLLAFIPFSNPDNMYTKLHDRKTHFRVYIS